MAVETRHWRNLETGMTARRMAGSPAIRSWARARIPTPREVERDFVSRFAREPSPRELAGHRSRMLEDRLSEIPIAAKERSRVDWRQVADYLLEDVRFSERGSVDPGLLGGLLVALVLATVLVWLFR